MFFQKSQTKYDRYAFLVSFVSLLKFVGMWWTGHFQMSFVCLSSLIGFLSKTIRKRNSENSVKNIWSAAEMKTNRMHTWFSMLLYIYQQRKFCSKRCSYNKEDLHWDQEKLIQNSLPIWCYKKLSYLRTAVSIWNSP